jgi:hypothetical protein
MAGDTLDAERARAIGVVDDAPARALDAGVQSLLGGIAGAAPGSLRAIKRLVRAPEVGALERAMAAEGAAQLQALQSPEFAGGSSRSPRGWPGANRVSAAPDAIFRADLLAGQVALVTSGRHRDHGIASCLAAAGASVRSRAEARAPGACRRAVAAATGPG